MPRCDAKTKRGERCKRQARWVEWHSLADISRYLCGQHHEEAFVDSVIAQMDGKPFDGWQTVNVIGGDHA